MTPEINVRKYINDYNWRYISPFKRSYVSLRITGSCPPYRWELWYVWMVIWRLLQTEEFHVFFPNPSCSNHVFCWHSCYPFEFSHTKNRHFLELKIPVPKNDFWIIVFWYPFVNFQRGVHATSKASVVAPPTRPCINVDSCGATTRLLSLGKRGW